MLHTIKSLLWGMPTVCAVIGFGVYFTFKSRAYNIRGIKEIFRSSFRELKVKSPGISAFSAISTSLGGTIGIGSITGAAFSLAVGGPGSIFWMWVTGFFGCMLKYAETSTALRYRVRDGDICSGGAMYALEKSGKPFLGKVFAFCLLASSFGTGNMTQSSAVRASLGEIGLSGYVTGALLSALFLFAVSGGRKKIASFSEKTVPFSSAVYLIIIIALILPRITLLPSVLCTIIRSAFGLRQFGGGAMGYTVSAAMKTGVTRCVFSSEMGMGTSAIAHSSNETASPHSQGSWAIIEMMTDIFVFSTLTALALLLYGEKSVEGLFYSSFGKAGSVTLGLLLFMFGFASIISWCFYAESCMSYLGFSKAKHLLYIALSALCVFLGCITDSAKIWDIADILNFFMMIPNLYLLFIKRKEICLCFGKTKR